MNLQPLSFYDLKPLDPAQSTNQIRGKETISVSKKCISISKRLFESLGRPEKVEFALDTEKNLLGIKAAAPDSKFGFTVSNYDTKDCARITGQNLTSMLLSKRNINGNSRYMVLLDPWKDAGYFLFDIDKAFVKKIEKRSK